MHVGPTLVICPLQIHGGGVVASGSDWERFSFANPGASVAQFLQSYCPNL